MDEFEFINRIRPTSYKQASLVKGVGDDAAIIRTTEDIVTATDTFVEQIHFSERTTEPYHIGWRALAANISDIAAMGAIPKFYLVSIVAPHNKSDNFLLEIYEGMRELASRYGMDLIGGDTVSGKELCLSVSIIGFTAKNKACYRSNARVGDIVFVSGTIGDSRAGLEILTTGLPELKNKRRFIRKHQLPLPQVELGRLLQSFDRVALNDISDGIANELQEIAEASHISIVIDDDKIPVDPHLRELPTKQTFKWKYFGGEDFELVGTMSESNWQLAKTAAMEHDIKVTEIGKVVNKQTDNSRVLLKKDGAIAPLYKRGYTHLK